MAFTELKPAKTQDRVTFTCTKKGSFLIGISAGVAKTIGLEPGAKARVMMDIERSPRAIRVIADKAGPFTARGTKGGGILLGLGPIKGLPKLSGKQLVEFDVGAFNGEAKAAMQFDVPGVVGDVDVRFSATVSSIAPERKALPPPPNGKAPPPRRYYHRDENDIDDPIAAAKL